MDLLDRIRSIAGDVAECGVFKGGSLCAMGLHLKANGSTKHIFGLDSFHGFDRSVCKDIEFGGAVNIEKDRRLRQHFDRPCAYKAVAARPHDMITLVPRYFSDTIEQLAEMRFSFVHLDCDIYDFYKQTLAFFHPRMWNRRVILFDEYNDPPWPGCRLAIDEFLAGSPERPIAIARDNYEKFYIERLD